MDGFKRWLKTGLVAVILVGLSLGLSAAWWDFGGGDNSRRESRLAPGNAITSGESLLQYALPIDNDAVRKIQGALEDIGTQLRSRRRWSAIKADLSEALTVLNLRKDELLASVPEENGDRATSLLTQIKQGLSEFEDIAEAQDKEQAWIQRRELLDKVGKLEALMVDEFPFDIPEEYSDLPRLKGRARVKFETERGDMEVIVDGYNAPLTAGNFVDLVERDFYDGLDITRAEKFYVVQTGDPPGPETGFVDPETGETRTIPMEIRIKGEEKPIYGTTLEQAGLYRAQPVLPFSAYGAMAMGHPDIDPNGGSSQFFFLRFDTELTPPGFNVLDGRYTVFGYLVEGEDVLEDLEKGDIIESAEVISGADNLVRPSQSKSKQKTAKKTDSGNAAASDEGNAAATEETTAESS